MDETGLAKSGESLLLVDANAADPQARRTPGRMTFRSKEEWYIENFNLVPVQTEDDEKSTVPVSV